MAHRDPSSPTPMPTILRYGTAVLSVAIAIGLGFFLLRHFDAILTPFLFAVAATVWYAGTGPGVLAIVLSVLSLNYFFLRPFSFSPISYADLVYLTFCIFCALAVGSVSAVRRRAEQELRQAREGLEAKVVERTANLQRSEAHLAEAQRRSHSGVLAYNEATILYGSEETYRIWGFDPAQGVPSFEAVFQRVHPDDRDRHRAQVQSALHEKRGYSIAYRIVLPDGTVKHLESIDQPVFSASGELVEVVATQIDVTERVRAAQALRESEARIRRLVDSNIIGIFFSGLEGRVLETNDAFLHLVGHDRDDLVSGRIRWTDLTPPEWRERDRRALAELTSNTTAQPYEKEFFRKDGSRVPVLIGGALFEEGGNEGVAFVLDLTELKRAEQMQSDFVHMNRVSVMGELVASLSHEIAQPIASTRIYARAAQNFFDMQAPDLGEVREALAGIVGNAGRAGDIIERIRDQIQKTPPRKEQFDLNAAIDEVIVLGRSIITKNRVWVQTRLSERLFPVHGARVQLQQVVLNLLLNAVEAMGSVEAAPRELLISTSQDHTGVLVAVLDSGPGIHPENLDRVFDSFYTTKPSGTGMGLSICRSIIEAHGGRLWAEANEPRGAIFQFTLPAA